MPQGGLELSIKILRGLSKTKIFDKWLDNIKTNITTYEDTILKCLQLKSFFCIKCFSIFDCKEVNKWGYFVYPFSDENLFLNLSSLEDLDFMNDILLLIKVTPSDSFTIAETNSSTTYLTYKHFIHDTTITEKYLEEGLGLLLFLEAMENFADINNYIDFEKTKSYLSQYEKIKSVKHLLDQYDVKQIIEKLCND